MKSLFSGLILGLLLCIGCLPVTHNAVREEKLPDIGFREGDKAATTVAKSVPVNVPETSPERIDDKNAWERAKQLRAELQADSGR